MSQDGVFIRNLFQFTKKVKEITSERQSKFSAHSLKLESLRVLDINLCSRDVVFFPKKMQENNNDELMICNILGIILKQSKQLIYI